MRIQPKSKDQTQVNQSNEEIKNYRSGQPERNTERSENSPEVNAASGRYSLDKNNTDRQREIEFERSDVDSNVNPTNNENTGDQEFEDETIREIPGSDIRPKQFPAEDNR